MCALILDALEHEKKRAPPARRFHFLWPLAARFRVADRQLVLVHGIDSERFAAVGSSLQVDLLWAGSCVQGERDCPSLLLTVVCGEFHLAKYERASLKAGGIVAIEFGRDDLP